MNECRHGTCTLKIQIMNFRELHLRIFEFTACVYENQQFDYFFSQIIVFINLLVPFTDVGKLFLILISNSDTAVANPVGIFLKGKG